MIVEHNHKVIVFTAPSGSGKTTITRAVMSEFSQLAFSVSATTRPKRDGEQDGVNYFFLTLEEFKNKVDAGEFLEWEEVYPGVCYGTLASEVERLFDEHKIPVFDVDVKGAVSIKKYFGNNALIVFIKVPIDILVERLRNRGTETEETLETRRERFSFELSYEDQFDITIENIDLNSAIEKAHITVQDFLSI
jgi:guanylate kinase